MMNEAAAVAANVGTNNRVSAGRRGTTAVVASLTVLMLGATALVGSTNRSASKAPASRTFQLSAAELADWEAQTATPELRAVVVEKMRAAFSGVAQVGVGERPAVSEVHEVVPSNPNPDLKLILAYGVSGNHFWVTASYADMARGAIWGAAYACTYRYGLPSWLCNGAADQLDKWARGWGSANNHGVWGAIYWSPPHWDGGRW